MVTVVVMINMLISLMLLYVAWQVWKLKQKLAKIADRLIAAERSTYVVLHGAGEAIYKSQGNIHNLRRKNQPQQLQIQRVRQILSLLVGGQQVWRRYFLRLGSKSWRR